MIKTYKDLLVWQKSVDLATTIYKITDKFPKTEMYGIISQMRRSAVSTPSNIAEGRQRGSRKDFTQFLRISLGSVAELETQLVISKNLKLLNEPEYLEVISTTEEIGRMLRAIIRKLNESSKPQA